MSNKHVNVISNFLRQKNYSEEAIAGILGNIQGEVGISMDPDTDQMNGPAYGIVQWDGSAYPLVGSPTTNGREYVKRMMTQAGIVEDYRSAIAQVKLLDWSMYNGQWIGKVNPQKVEDFKKLKSPEQAANTFEENYERPRNAHPERQTFARNWYNQLNDNSAPNPEYVKSDFLASIKGSNIKLWGDLDGTKPRTTTTNGQVFHVVCYYNYRSGDVVYSLYNQDNSWAGYLNSKFAIEVKYTAFGKEIVVNRANVNVYNDLYSDVKRNSSTDIIGKVFIARGFYTLGNGVKIYTLYDKEGKWHGYLDSKATSTIEYHAREQLVSISVDNKNIWNDLSLTNVRTTTTGKLGKAYNQRAYYNMENGAKFVSIYNKDGSWGGYIDFTHLIDVIYTAFNKDVIISKKGYFSYTDFFFSEQRISTDDYLNKVFTARGFYTLGNGREYYTLYDTTGKWHGYLNTDATTLK